MRNFALSFAILGSLLASIYLFRKESTPITAKSSPVVTDGQPAITGKVSTTVGNIRPRRRHENDMDFSKYNPFYWQGRLTSFKVEDFTSKGENLMVFTLYNEWPQDYIPTRGPDFSAIYTGDPNHGTELYRSKFLINDRMQMLDDHKTFQATIRPADHGLKRGDVLVFEFRFFFSESNPDWQHQRATNGHNISAYYSEFLRVVIGESGLVIDDPERTNVLPSQLRYAGGKTTSPTTRVEPWKGLEQMATNILPANAQAFLFGRTWTHTNFSTGEHVGELSDDKPSIFFEGDRAYRAGYQATAYNVHDCVACHEQNGSKLLPAVGEPVHTTVLRTALQGSLAKHPSFGGQVQTQGPDAEGTVRIKEWKTKVETLAGGETVELRWPIWSLETGRNRDGLLISPRRPLSFVGLGLLDAIPESQIRTWARDNGGTLSTIDGKVGRFGHRAEQPTLMSQILSALNTDLGVMSESSPHIDGIGAKPGKGKLFDAAMNDVESYISLLAVPPRMNPEGQAVQRGDILFRSIGCASCHVPSVTTGESKFAELSGQEIQPFTDLLLHDMGDGLKDDISSKWRTAPLWGFAIKRASTDARTNQFQPGNINILWKDSWNAVKGNRIEMLHDGRARSLKEAILWHGGAAEDSKNAFKNLSRDDREDVISFLEDL